MPLGHCERRLGTMMAGFCGFPMETLPEQSVGLIRNGNAFAPWTSQPNLHHNHGRTIVLAVGAKGDGC